MNQLSVEHPNGRPDSKHFHAKYFLRLPANTTTHASHSSRTVTTFPAFLRPSVNPSPECDLWGPMCQTGTIVVDVNLTSTVTPTTVPCSFYLSAQSSSAMSASAASFAQGPLDYRSSFGRSPQCTSYHNVLQQNRANYDLAIFPLSNCPSNTSGTLLPAARYFPAGSFGNVGGHATDTFYCCGNCTMFIDQVKVLYLPEEGAGSCAGGNDTTPLRANLSAITTKPAHSLANNGNGLATYKGYTL